MRSSGLHRLSRCHAGNIRNCQFFRFEERVQIALKCLCQAKGILHDRANGLAQSFPENRPLSESIALVIMIAEQAADMIKADARR
jgi:hypothetical protein